MHGVIQLLYKYGYHLIFIILQISSFTLIINYSGKQKDIYINTSNYYASKVASLSSQVNKFIRLNVINDSLMLENANLIENLILVDYLNDTTPLARQLYEQYAIIPSNICSKTFHLNNNYLTLCKEKCK